MSKKIIVVGSYSVGLFLNGSIPLEGETQIANGFFETFGGKGSNQAVTARKMGGDVQMICKVGRDRYADDMLNMYKSIGMNTDSVLFSEDKGTSIGAIIVDPDGRNAISNYLGANLDLTAKEAIDLIRAQEDKPFLVGFQLESDRDMVLECIKACADMNIPTLLDPAPAAPLPEWIYPHITYIKPNEHEAAVLSGISIQSPQDAFRAGRWFIEAGVREAIITLGENGTVYVTRDCEKYFEAIHVNAVDSTGAGDVFSGTLMTAMSQGMPMDRAIVYANCAASLSVTKSGVTESIPTIEEVNALFTKVCMERGM